MIEVSCRVEAENHECLKVHNCDYRHNAVIIETTDGKKYIVNAKDLITAVENATNTNYYSI